jgi:hypothetical protein
MFYVKQKKEENSEEEPLDFLGWVSAEIDARKDWNVQQTR